MAEKMIESTRTGTTRSSSYLNSIYDDNDYLELVWKKGQVVVQGGSSRPTQMNTPSRIGHSHGNSHQSSYQNSCQLDLLYSKSKSSCSYKLEDGCVSRPVKESKLTTGGAHQVVTTENGCLRTPSKQNCLPSDTFKKPRMASSQTTASNSLIQDLGKVINFSNALRPSALAKSTYEVKSANEIIKAMKVAEVAAGGAATSSKATGDSAVIDSYRGSRALIGPQGKNPLVSGASNPVSFVARSQEPLPCKQFEAVGHNSVLRTKRKADTNFCNEPLLESSSVYSLGASNNPDICSSKQAGTDVSTRISDNDEDTEDVLKEKDAQGGNRVKRSRNAETHNSSERKRREKINKKMRVLKELIPNCNKVDKASMLDDAIEYLKTLKIQLQIMSMGTGLSMPFMMLPTGPLHHMMNTPHLPQLMGAGMGFRPGGAGIPPCNLPQFSIPPQPGSITDNRVPMFGFPNQLLPMPMSHAPFIPMVGKPSTQPLQATCTAANLAENLASAHQLATLQVSGPSNSL